MKRLEDYTVSDALSAAEQLADIAGGWSLDEVEIDGKMVSTYDLADMFQVVLAELDDAE